MIKNEMIAEKLITERLKLLRMSANVSQADLAKELGTHQNAISKMENGHGGSLKLFFQLIGFYSETFYLGNLFSNYFDIVLLSDFEDRSVKFKDVIKEQLKLMHEEQGEKIQRIEALLDGK